MKSKLCSVLVVLSIAVLSATAVHADEPDAGGVDETVGQTGEPADPVTALLQSEVVRYYRGIGADSTEAELKSGLEAAFDMVLADVAIQQISLAVDEAIRRHESGVDVPFAVAVPRFVRALAEEDARAVKGDASEAAQQPAWRAAADQVLDLQQPWKRRFSLEVERHRRDWGIVTGVMLGTVGGVAGIALPLGAAADLSDGPFALIIGSGHLGVFVVLGHFLNTVNLTLVGIKGVVATSPSAEVALRRMHRARVGTGVAAAVLAGVGTAVVPLGIALSDGGFDYADGLIPVAIGCGVAALTLLSISSAHLALEVEFQKLAAGGKQRSTRKAPAVRVVVTPTGIVGWF